MNWYFASGDLGFFWQEQLHRIGILPKIYHPQFGFGFNSLMSLWLDYPFQLFLFVCSFLGISWFWIEKILWLSVFVIAWLSSRAFASIYLKQAALLFVSSMIYSLNTYILLLFSGGQLGVAWAYGLAPYVLFRFFRPHVATRKDSIATGLIVALLVAFDLRIAYCIVFALLLYGGVTVTKYLALSISVAISVHLYWLLPILFVRSEGLVLGEEFTDRGMLTFLSFADFSHTLSLLHPNWPDNLFGKTSFMQPEFICIPILAFAGLLVVRVKSDLRMRYFALMAVVGAFFSKGVQEPFGVLYSWMFSHIPGFVMFRDPTKFYLFIALAYSILIPFALSKISQPRIRMVGIMIFVLFWAFTLRGISVPVSHIPGDYIHLKDLLLADPLASRALWIPAKEGFSYSSDVHPILVSRDDTTVDSSVGYVIVPLDIFHRIFLTGYRYEPTLREKIIAGLVHKGFVPIEGFEDLAVFRNPNFIGMTASQMSDTVMHQQFVATWGAALSAVAFIIAICLLLF